MKLSTDLLYNHRLVSFKVFLITACCFSLLFLPNNMSAQWVQQGARIEGKSTFQGLGEFVALSVDGSIVAVDAGEGVVQVYKNTNGTWTQLGLDIKEISFFNSRVTLSADGTLLAVGFTATKDVKIYKFLNGSWIKQATLASDPNRSAARSVAFSNDGSILAVGTTSNSASSGFITVYKNINSTWTRLGDSISWQVNNQLGFFVALSANGAILASSDTKGAARVYQNTNNIWSQVGATLTGDANDLGLPVALSADGSILAVGFKVDSTGYVKVFKNINNTWVQQGATLNGTANVRSVALSANGSVLAIGSATYLGSAKIYKNVNGTWIQQGVTIVEATTYSDQLGKSIALSADGAIVAIGAPYTTTSVGIFAGALRIYKNNLLSAVNRPNALQEAGDIQIYPSLTDGVVQINTALPIQQIWVSNVLGQIVLTTPLALVNLSALPSGLYRLVVKTQDKVFSQSVFKQ
jgi:hypothetical protein